MNTFYINERIKAGRHWARVFAIGLWEGLYDEYERLTGPAAITAARLVDATRFAYNHLLQDFVHLTYEVGKLWSEVLMLRTRNAVLEKQISDALNRAKDAEARVQLRPFLRPGDSVTAYGVACEIVPKHALEDYSKLIAKNIALHEQVFELQCGIAELKTKGVPMYIEPKVRMRMRMMCCYGATSQRARVEAVDQHGTVLAKYDLPVGLAPPPVRYGVDLGRDGKIVVTVMQGGKILHVIDVEQEWNKIKFLRVPFLMGRMVFNPLRKPSGVIADDHGAVDFSAYNLKDAVAAADPAPAAAPKEPKPARHGWLWSGAEDNSLVRRYVAGGALAFLAQLHKREPEAIVYRLARLADWPRAALTHGNFLARAPMWFFDGAAAAGSRHLRQQVRHRRMTRDAPPGALQS